MRKRTLAGFVAAAAVVSTSISVYSIADDKTQPAMSPEQAKQMEAWTRHMTPGPQHAAFQQLVGKFKADAKFKMDANAPEQASTGEANNTLILGGRFIQTEYAGDMMGQPFKGMQLFGYDNSTRKYQCVWVDEMSTSMMISDGTSADDGKTINLSCTYFCPITQGQRKSRMVFTVKSADEHTFEMYDLADGKETKMMWITYTRMK